MKRSMLHVVELEMGDGGQDLKASLGTALHGAEHQAVCRLLVSCAYESKAAPWESHSDTSAPPWDLLGRKQSCTDGKLG